MYLKNVVATDYQAKPAPKGVFIKEMPSFIVNGPDVLTRVFAGLALVAVAALFLVVLGGV